MKTYNCKCGEIEISKFYPKNKSKCKKCILEEAKNKKDEVLIQQPWMRGFKKAWNRDNVLHARFISAKSTSGKRGLEFDLNIEDIYEIYFKQNRKCAYTGVLFDITSEIYSPSLDRIDNTRGYLKDNIQLIISSANFMKSNHTEEEFFQIIKEIYEFKLKPKKADKI